jgi:selT/selW/selH-like putative selenoprotein
VDATPGAKGQFDVLADSELIFSKKEAGRFPEEGELIQLLPSGP